jgi:hypothetical protein
MFDEFVRNWCHRMHLDRWKSSLDLLARWHPCLRKQEDLDWVLEALQLRRCRRRFGLPASLIATLFAILCGANLKYGSLKSQNQDSDPEDEGGAGVLQQGHRGEGLHELEAQDLGCC